MCLGMLVCVCACIYRRACLCKLCCTLYLFELIVRVIERVDG